MSKQSTGKRKNNGKKKSSRFTSRIEHDRRINEYLSQAHRDRWQLQSFYTYIRQSWHPLKKASTEEKDAQEWGQMRPSLIVNEWWYRIIIIFLWWNLIYLGYGKLKKIQFRKLGLSIRMQSYIYQSHILIWYWVSIK